MEYEQEDEREMMDIPPNEQGLDTAKVTFNCPVPSVEQVCGEVARQLIQSQSWESKSNIMKQVREKLDELVTDIITAKAKPIIEELLAKPLQPTDNFGNPIGEPTSLQGVIAKRVEDWCGDEVDRDGKARKKDHYSGSSVATRMEHLIGQMTSYEMKREVDKQVSEIVAKLKAQATQSIAKQIAEKVASVVLT